MKKMLSVLLVLGMLLTLSGAALAAEETVVAGIVFQDDEFMNDLINGMKKAADELGVTLMTANSSNDQSREVELINTYVSQGVNGICIAPLDPDTSIATLRIAAEQGVQVSTVNLELSDVDFLAGGYCSDDYSNGYMIGQSAAQWIQENYDRPVKFGLIHFDHQVPAQSTNRYGGFFTALDDAGIEYEIVANQGAEREDTALIAANDIITANPDVDLFYGANGGGLVGAVRAIEQSGLAGKVYAFGYDANDIITSLLLSDDGILLGVAIQDPFNQGYHSLKLLVNAIRGEAADIAGGTAYVEGKLLLRANPDEVMAYRVSQGFEG